MRKNILGDVRVRVLRIKMIFCTLEIIKLIPFDFSNLNDKLRIYHAPLYYQYYRRRAVASPCMHHVRGVRSFLPDRRRTFYDCFENRHNTVKNRMHAHKMSYWWHNNTRCFHVCCWKYLLKRVMTCLPVCKYWKTNIFLFL